MKPGFLPDGRWSSLIRYVSARVDLEETARRYGALRRRRKIRSAEELLHLALMYGPGRQSLRSTAGLTVDAGLADLSDKGVMGRLQHMGEWLAHVLAVLLAEKLGKRPEPAGGLDLGVVDGSLICSPGSGENWRLHARFDPALGRFTDLVLSDAKQAERSDRTRIEPGETIIQDRGYARVRNFAAVLGAGGDFITRLGWRSLRLLDAEGQTIDLLSLLAQSPAIAEQTVYLHAIAQPLRLVIHRLPPEQAERQRKRVKRKSGKAGHQMDPRTATAAGYLMLLTSLPAQRATPERIVQLYRQRWQVELGFKRLKTIGGIDQLPATNPALARTWLLAHLIAAVLTDELACRLVGFPPSSV